MTNALTDSKVHRQNILNNPFAISEIQKATQLQVVHFEGRAWILNEQVADFFAVDPRTIERLLEQNGDELGKNGYAVIRGKRMPGFKLAISESGVTDIDVGNKTPVLGIFDFRAFLNISLRSTDKSETL